MTAPLNDEQLGGIAARLAAEFPRWLERRIEHVTYLDATMTRWSVGVMFQWPQKEFFLDGATPEPGNLVYVPLDLLTKGQPIGLEGVRPDGSPFPILPFSRSADLASAGVSALVWSRFEALRGRELGADSLRTLDAIVRSPPRLAERLLDVIQDASSDLGVVLKAHDEVRGLLEELGSNVILLAPAVYQPGEAVVYRYNYCEPAPRKDPLRGRTLRACR